MLNPEQRQEKTLRSVDENMSLVAEQLRQAVLLLEDLRSRVASIEEKLSKPGQ